MWIHKQYSGVRGNMSLVVYGIMCKRCDGTSLLQQIESEFDVKIQRDCAIPDTRASAQVYPSCVRSSMIYGNETRLLLADGGLKFDKHICRILTR